MGVSVPWDTDEAAGVASARSGATWRALPDAEPRREDDDAEASTAERETSRLGATVRAATVAFGFRRNSCRFIATRFR